MKETLNKYLEIWYRIRRLIRKDFFRKDLEKILEKMLR